MTETKKPFWKRWWAIAIAALIVIGGIGSIINPPQKVEIPDVAGKPAAEAKQQLSDLGFTVFVKQDGKSVINPADFDVESSDPATGEQVSEKSTVTLNVVEATERLAAEAKAAEEEKARKEAEKKAEAEKAAKESEQRQAEYAATPLEAVEAQTFCSNYADLTFPYGVKMHWLVGKLAEEKTDDGWYMKVEATVTNEYGAKRKGVNIECHMSGTNGAPSMDDFVSY